MNFQHRTLLSLFLLLNVPLQAATWSWTSPSTWYTGLSEWWSGASKETKIATIGAGIGISTATALWAHRAHAKNQISPQASTSNEQNSVPEITPEDPLYKALTEVLTEQKWHNNISNANPHPLSREAAISVPIKVIEII
ncbi:MAG: hypothetical protein M1114_02560 [Candidatus Dependentiae bacterium]|nr:hypothetical protein [Candidatus Dependentiae bacterium]